LLSEARRREIREDPPDKEREHGYITDVEKAVH
jgi:hypothetical protein